MDRAFAFLRGPLLGASGLDSQRGAQPLPPKHLLLFNISVLSPERTTPMVTISVKTAKTSSRSVVVLHPEGSELTKTSAPSTVGSKACLGGTVRPVLPGSLHDHLGSQVLVRASTFSLWSLGSASHQGNSMFRCLGLRCREAPEQKRLFRPRAT